MNPAIVGVTPAMPTGCSMNIMQARMPERVFDVGIAEGHAVTFSGGLATQGMLPYCNIYSSFMQRAYDNVIHDVVLQGLTWYCASTVQASWAKTARPITARST